MNTLFFGDSNDPWRNLAAEELMFLAPSAGMTLYLWQNANTVVIGRNQNAWKECRAELLEKEGGTLARRTTGGGAVYHDLGNLNFTFVCAREQYDLARQTGVILAAVQSLGVNAAFSGRNDLVTADGAKFSGNAFRFSKTAAMQHGTLLVSSDFEKLSRYLAPNPEKLRAKGVESVRARVVNLASLSSRIDVAAMRASVCEAFLNEYGASQTREVTTLDGESLQALYARNASWEWRMGATPRFDLALETRFSWGSLEVQLALEQGRIREATVFSDAMDETFIASLAPALQGARLSGDALAARVEALASENMETPAEIAAWFRGKSF